MFSLLLTLPQRRGDSVLAGHIFDVYHFRHLRQLQTAADPLDHFFRSTQDENALWLHFLYLPGYLAACFRILKNRRLDGADLILVPLC